MSSLRASAILLRRRPALYAVIVAVLLAVLALVYSASSPGSYSATANIAVFSGGPDSLVPSTQITGAGLDPYLAILRSFRVAEDAAERLPGIPPPNRTAFVTVASEIARRVKVGIDRKSQSVEVTATASSAERAAAIANGVAGGLLQVRGAEYQNVARDAVNELIAKARGLPTNARARSAAIAALRARFVPLLAERQIQVLRAAKPSSRPLLVTAVAGAIALLAILVLLIVTGILRPRARSAAR